MEKKICAIVVTYNRKLSLLWCLESLLAQNIKLDSIIIIDNASTDGTEDMLKAKYLKNKLFDYVNLGDNLGGAGGFHHGIKRAYRKGFDWMWLMDDDVKALPDSLENYMKYTDKFICIQGRRNNFDGTVFKWGHTYDHKTGKKGAIDEEKIFRNHDYLNISFLCFEGSFINRKLVEKIGLPDKFFFISGDDSVYGLLASKVTNIAYIKEITLERTLDKKREFFNKKLNRLSPFSLYYLIRNKFLVEKYCKHIFPEHVNHNLAIYYLVIKLVAKIIIVENNKIELLKSLIRGFNDGKKIQSSSYNFNNKL